MLQEDQIIHLGNKLNNEGYCQINNFFHPQFKEYLHIGSQMLSLDSNFESEGGNGVVKTNNQYSKALYSPSLGENLLIHLTNTYSQISRKNLIPTYSYYRKYHQTNLLKKHTDRPSCQYSATIQIDSSEDISWPIWVKDKKGNDIKCNTKVGDIIFYKGEEVEHWRDELEYEYSSHIFLHWVDGNNPNYKEFWFDGRERLGVNR